MVPEVSGVPSPLNGVVPGFDDGGVLAAPFREWDPGFDEGELHAGHECDGQCGAGEVGIAESDTGWVLGTEG